MPKYMSPGSFSPDNIGEVVAIQIFRRAKTDPNELLTESMVKHVGTLVYYNSQRDCVTFRLKYQDMISINTDKKVVEIYIRRDE